MEQQQYSKLFSFLWNIANDVLVQAFDPSEYKKITLPFIVLRRLDLLLESTKGQVLNMCQSDEFKQLPEESQEQQLYLITGHPFFNRSSFTMNNLRAETDSMRLYQNFLAYLDGFSRHVQDIITKFDMRHYAERLSALNPPRLGAMLGKVTDEQINLGLNPVLDDDGNEKLPGLDNHTMGTLFEELIRKFNETYSITDAGLHYTPRDYVAVLTDLAILPVVDRLKNGSYEIYDGACGTGGILSLAQERFSQIAKERGKRFKTYLYGQELMPETFATCEADLMLSGSSTNFYYNQNGVSRSRFAFGSTISQDGHPGKKFDFCISNPPFGTPWKNDLDNWGISKKDDIKDSRFYYGDLSFIPDIGDPQMLFLANNVSRMKDDEQGTRIVEIHNGSSLFTGNAGSGASNLRRYIIENDMLEAIIAMPENDFYNTGIGTFVWIVTNRKAEHRRGKVQLIDATKIKTPLRKNLGNKNCETNEENRAEIVRILMDFRETETSKIFPNEEFGYWQITVNRPLRIVYENPDNITLPELKNKADVQLLADALRAWKELLGGHTVGDFAFFHMLLQAKVKVPASKIKLIRQYLGKRSECADVCHTKPTNLDSPLEIDPLLRDTEQVPLRYEGGIEAFMQREVLPYAPDAFYDADSVQVGYELSFTKYFYKPVELRPIADITADIEGIEHRLQGVLGDILNI